ncbi:MAG: hypothetical protein IKD47_04700 [Clostridia bacterium]|nr:hypothetical protein [Clostridia bacterium]
MRKILPMLLTLVCVCCLSSCMFMKGRRGQDTRENSSAESSSSLEIPSSN